MLRLWHSNSTQRLAGLSLVALAGSFSAAACRSDDSTDDASAQPTDDRVHIGHEEFRVGSIDGPDALTPPSDAVIVEDQRVFVLFPQEAQIRVFDANGRVVGVVGRRGSGPGEFATPGAVQLLGDSIAVLDGIRISLFPIAGGEPRTFTPLAGQALPAGNITQWSIGLLAGENVLLRPRIPRSGLQRNSVDSIRLSVLRNVGERASWFATMNHQNRTMVIRDLNAAGPGAVVAPYPFADDDLWAIQANGTAVILVNRSDWAGQGAIRLLMLAPAGDTTVSRRVSVSAGRRILEQEIDSAVARWVDVIMESNGARPPNPVVGARWVRDALGKPPEFHAPVETVIGTSDGGIWLQREAGSSAPGWQEWLRLDPSGNPQEWVRLPAELRVLDVRGDVVWGWVQDELEVPYVVRYRLTGPARSGRLPTS